jgi:hypothetical protein
MDRMRHTGIHSLRAHATIPAVPSVTTADDRMRAGFLVVICRRVVMSQLEPE